MKNPLLYEINTRILLRERGRALGRPATLDEIPDMFLDQIAARGFEWVWFMGVWQTGKEGPAVSRTLPELRAACLQSLPDAQDEDICGSPFAIQSYIVNRDFGGNAALAGLRQRLRLRGLHLLLDFVPNHVALDHPWVQEHPEYFIQGTEHDLTAHPHNYTRVRGRRSEMILAHGRDPFFPGWPDTLQINYRHQAARGAMMGELSRIAGQCDGLRCDMAMLVQPDVFLRTWGEQAAPLDGSYPVDHPFWPEAIGRVRQQYPHFLFIAEVYWDMEWNLQQEGFDFTYDKRLYDRLRAGVARPVREHLAAGQAFQERSLRFLENHDEPRAAAVFGPMHHAAAVITYFVPGMRFFHEGQLEGRQSRVSAHLGRRLAESVNKDLQSFYNQLFLSLKRPEVHDGDWRLWTCRPAWEGNGTSDQFIIFSWEQGDRRLLAAANYGAAQAQCYVPLDMRDATGRIFTLTDLLSNARYIRRADDLANPGLYLDMPPWDVHLFEMRETS